MFALGQTKNAVILAIVIVLGSIFSKFLSGLFGGKLIGFKWSKSSIIGVATIPRLTITLAVVFTGFKASFFDHELVAAIVILSLVTTLIGPFLINALVKNKKLASI